MTAQKPTEICISIDTEFSIAGHFQNPDALPVSDVMVYGEVDGREQGLGFLLETFERHGISATFFVECANFFYFGDEPMKAVVERIQAAGQDIQLHVHPVWLSFVQDEIPGNFPRNDYCAYRDFDDLRRIFELCIEVFERWVGKPPVAIRTGSLVTDENVYKVMAALNIPLASNIGTGIFQPEPSLRHDSGRHLIHGVMEVPVFTYNDRDIAGRVHRKSLQITSCAWPEMEQLLWRGRHSGVENIVILTHPTEFIKRRDYRYREITRNRVNQQRLEKLCAFIGEHPGDFQSVDFGSHCEAWSAEELQQPFIGVPPVYPLLRKLHNGLNDLLWSY